MSDENPLNPNFDSRDDAGKGDPDATSKTLRRYHQLLWSKPLPNGQLFDLVTTRRGCYLLHESSLGRFVLSSDTVVPTFRAWGRMRSVIEQVSTEDLDAFQVLNHSMGGAMVFPGERRPGSLTINGARGLNRQVADRFDLTLEAVRRHYGGEQSPLSKVLFNYRDFFDLFGTFNDYVRYFLLDDLVDRDYQRVRFFTPFDDFGLTSPLPQTLHDYLAYRDQACEFLQARNRRIDDWARSNLSGD